MMTTDSALTDLDPFDLFDIESERLRHRFQALRGDDWLLPTRCAGWRMREMIAHLAGSEEYNLACLDDQVDVLAIRSEAAGAAGLDAFNDWMVARRAEAEPGQVLDEWLQANDETRRRLRRQGRSATLPTFAGPYPAGLQAFHLAMEAATHADDVDAPVGPAEEPDRTRWRARVVRWHLRHEHDPVVHISVEEGRNVIPGVPGSFTDAHLVAAATARLPEADPMPSELRERLRAFA